MTTTIGATYDTTRGAFKVLEERPQQHALLIRRTDGRDVLIALSDWLTWEPQPYVGDPPL